MVVVGLVGGAVVVTVVVLARRTPASPLDGEPDWAPLTLTGPTGPPGVMPPTVAPADAWVAPEATGGCPDSHPIKANRSSRIFHGPGGHFYDRTRAERCYCDPAAAEADGFRAAKR